MPAHPDESYRDTVAGMDLIDTHCHLDLPPLIAQLPQLLAAASRAGVNRFVLPGVHPDDWQQIIALASAHQGILAAPGIHPMHACLADDDTLSRLDRLADGCTAIGEIGLDPAYPVPSGIQEKAFREQIRVAGAHGLPVLLHCRRAFQRTLQILQEEKTALAGGIMHAFSGSPEMAREFIRLGFAISLSGVLTWPDAVRPLRLAREIPLEHLVLETDAPDLTPWSHRGEPNQPAWLTEVLLALSVVKNIPPATVAAITSANSVRVLHLS